MSNDVVNFTEMQLDKLNSDVLFYAIEPIAGGLNGDRRLKFGTLMNKILGTDMGTTQEIKPDLVFSMRNSNASFNKQFTVAAIDEYLLGKTDFTDVVKEIKIRAIKGTARGFVTLENISKFIIKGDAEVLSLDNLDETSVRLIVAGENSKIDYSVFRSSLFGNQVYEELELIDNITITRGNSSAGKVSFAKLSESIVSNIGIESNRVTDSLSIYSKDSLGDGWATIGDIADFVLESITIPEFTLGVDKFNPADDFILFKSSALPGKYGAIHGPDLKSSILNTTVLQAIELDSANFYCEEGTVTMSLISANIMEKVDEKYSINSSNSENNINDGDSILFYSTGSGEGSNATDIKNVSFITVRDKILGNGNSLTINDNTIIYCKNGNDRGAITYAQLKSKLISDITAGG